MIRPSVIAGAAILATSVVYLAPPESGDNGVVGARPRPAPSSDKTVAARPAKTVSSPKELPEIPETMAANAGIGASSRLLFERPAAASPPNIALQAQPETMTRPAAPTVFGAVMENGAWKAVLVHDGNTYVVGPGEAIGSGFRVETLELPNMTIRDLAGGAALAYTIGMIE